MLDRVAASRSTPHPHLKPTLSSIAAVLLDLTGCCDLLTSIVFFLRGFPVLYLRSDQTEIRRDVQVVRGSKEPVTAVIAIIDR